MAFNINEFNANINKSGGLAQKSQFLAVIIPPAQLTPVLGELGITLEHFPLRIDTFEFPSRSVIPVEYRDYGPPRNFGGQANFTESSCSVILSSDMREREFFMRWQDLVVGNHRRRVEQIEGNRFDVGYFDDYKSNGIEVRQYNQTETSLENWVYATQLIDAYPQIVSNVETSWDGGAEIQKINITFQYRYFTEGINLLPGVERGELSRLFNPTVRAGLSVVGGQLLGGAIGNQVIPRSFTPNDVF